MKQYTPLHCHSCYSLLDGLSKCSQIADRVEEIGSDACAVTDHGSASSHIKFLKAMKEVNKRPILGVEMYVCKEDALKKTDENRKLAHMVVLAKNDEGWKDLIKLVSISNKYEQYYYHPRVDTNQLAQAAQNGNLMAFSGHIGSHLSNVLFADKEENENPLWREQGVQQAKYFQEMFGKDNFCLEKQLFDKDVFPLQKWIADHIQQISDDTGIPCLATPDAHYAAQKDAIDQRILLCTQMHTTMSQASNPNFMLSGFFRSAQYYIPSYDDMIKFGHTEQELENTMLFASRISPYEKILRTPVLPKFACPNGMSSDEYLRELCREGWKKKIEGKVNKDQHGKYADRVKHELEVLQGCKLSDYFLIVMDIMQYIQRNGWLVGPGRGSAAGCLVSYLIGITSIDPIPYNLLFERFYNSGRNTVDHISLPDIDMDMPKYAREFVIEYLRSKYGHDHVGQMVTFQSTKGRGAIQNVLRAYGNITAHEINQITKNIIPEYKVIGELEKMEEERGESSLILWCLENTPEKLREWCYLDDEGKFKGPLASRFEQAIRLEGVKTSQSKHAAGIVISPEPLDQMCPMILDSETKNPIVGVEMNDAEAIGALKMDCLGITTLDKLMGVQQDLAIGDIYEIQRPTT